MPYTQYLLSDKLPNKRLDCMRSIYSGILRLLWITSIILYIVAPLHISFSFPLYVIGVAFYLIGLFCYFKIANKKNYLDFDTLFLSFCTIEHFMGGLYLTSDEFSRLFISGVDTTVVIKASLLSIVGLLSYMEGSLIIKPNTLKVKKCKNRYSHDHVSLDFLFVAIVLLMIINYNAGAFDFIKSQYVDGVGSMQANGLIFQSLALLTTFIHIVCIVLFIRYIRGRSISRMQLFYIMVILGYAGALAIIGSRSVFLSLVLPFIMCYAMYVYPINVKKTIIVGVIGVVAMFSIQRLRSHSDVQIDSLFFLLSDVIAPSRTLYASMEYVDKMGLNYGQTMLPQVIGVFPGLSSYLGDWTTVGSAETMTRYLADGTTNSGLGTTIIVDIYICFGFLGVVFLMMYLGWFVHKRWKSPLFEMVVRVSLMSSCLFMGRAAYLLPLHEIVWCMVFIYILNSLGKRNDKGVVFSR